SSPSRNLTEGRNFGLGNLPFACTVGLSLGLLALDALLAAYTDLDLLGLGFGPLRQPDVQHAIVIAGVDVFGVDCVRQRERADKAAIAALDATEVLFLLFLLELALARNAQSVVLDLDVKVFLVDSGHFQPQLDAVLVLVNVHRRYERASSRERVFALATVLLFKQTVHAVLQGIQFADRVPTGQNRHNSNPPVRFLRVFMTHAY